jgi:hypothetical protein
MKLESKAFGALGVTGVAVTLCVMGVGTFSVAILRNA